MKKKVSIIVPIYNCSSLLDKCLKSLESQTYKNIEILLIDDGSIDNSKELSIEYAKRDDRFKYFYKENSGVSSTRNYGISKISGEITTFIDADDWIDEDYIEKCVEFYEKNNCDLLKTNYTIFNSANDSFVKYIYSDKSSKINHDEFLKILSCDGYFNSIWGAFYKTSILKTNNMEFDKNIIYGEDLFFQIENYHHFNNIYWLNLPGYYYFNNVNSATRKKGKKHLIKIINDVYKVYSYIYNKSHYKKTLCNCMFPILNDNFRYLIEDNNVNYIEIKKIIYDTFLYNFKEIKFKDIKIYGRSKFNNILIFLLARKKILLYYNLIKLKKNVVRR